MSVDWLNPKLGDLFEFKNGMNAEKAAYGDGVPFVNVMDVFGNDILTADIIRGKIKANPKQINDYLVKYGDILFNRTSETFDEIAMSAVYMDDKEVIFGGFVIRARPKGSLLNPAFCVYFFQSFPIRKELIRRGQGAVRSNIGQKDLATVPTVLPPFPEQKKIAEILSTWDRVIQVVEGLIKNSQAQKKALMQQLLTGKKRLPGFDGKWQVSSIKSMGNTSSGGTPSSDIEEYWDGEILWATPTDITALAGKYIKTTKRTITNKGLSSSSARLLPVGSLLICTRATIGYSAIAIKPLCTNQGFKNLTPISLFEVEFLYYLLQHFKHEFIRYACGSTFLELSKGDFEKLQFLTPKKDEQTAIATILSDADCEIEIQQNQLAQLKSEKSALMQQLLTGKCRVKIDKETAA